MIETPDVVFSHEHSKAYLVERRQMKSRLRRAESRKRTFIITALLCTLVAVLLFTARDEKQAQARPSNAKTVVQKKPSRFVPAIHISNSKKVVSDHPVPFAALIDQASERYGVDRFLLRAVIRQESAFNPLARSGANARGLMQMIPATAAALGITDAYDPAQSIDGGARYLLQQLQRFQSVSSALAAYNAGPGAVSRYGGVPPYRETQHYVTVIMAHQRAYRKANGNSIG